MRSMESESDIIERLLYAEGIVMDPKSSKKIQVLEINMVTMMLRRLLNLH